MTPELAKAYETTRSAPLLSTRLEAHFLILEEGMPGALSHEVQERVVLAVADLCLAMSVLMRRSGQ